MAPVIEEIIGKANSSSRKAWWAGNLNHYPPLIFGITAALAGVIAGASGLPEFHSSGSSWLYRWRLRHCLHRLDGARKREKGGPPFSKSG
jgi:hypothetical protein